MEPAENFENVYIGRVRPGRDRRRHRFPVSTWKIYKMANQRVVRTINAADGLQKVTSPGLVDTPHSILRKLIDNLKSNKRILSRWQPQIITSKLNTVLSWWKPQIITSKLKIILPRRQPQITTSKLKIVLPWRQPQTITSKKKIVLSRLQPQVQAHRQPQIITNLDPVARIRGETKKEAATQRQPSYACAVIREKPRFHKIAEGTFEKL